jgi:parallel beta helix pectate lyase-like protein
MGRSMISGISKQRRILFFSAFALAVAGCVPTTGGNGGGGGQTPPPTSCGAELHANLVLENDMTCAGPALTTKVAGLSIDLNGHTIRAATSGSGNGIVGPRVSVHNGTITGFDIGYLDSPPSDASAAAFTVDGVHFVDNGTGISDTGDAIHLTNSTFDGGHAASSIGVLLGQKSATATDDVSHDQFTNLETGITLAKWNGATIAHNTFSGNTSAVVVNFENSSIDVANNDIGSGGTGVLVANENNDLTIENNTVHDGLVGIWITSEPGFPNAGSKNNVITGNTVSGNGAAGIAVVANWAAFDGMVVSGNVAGHNGFAPGSATNAPVGTAPLNDGIYVNVSAGGTVSVANNQATGNADHGIAAFNVTDGGGNKASGNGAAQQCAGTLACT